MSLIRVLSLILILILACELSSAAKVSRQMPSRSEPGSIIEVALKVTNALPGKLFTIEETRPLQVEITDWEVEGATEPKEKIETRVKDLGYGWSFTPESTDAKIIYTAKVSPSATGALAFEAVYFDPEGFDKVRGSLTVARKEPAVKKGDIAPPLESDASDKTAKSGSSGSGSGETIGSPGVNRARSVLFAVILALLIVLAGIGIYLYSTRPRRRRDMFTHSFFKK